MEHNESSVNELEIAQKVISDYKYALDASSIVATTNQKGIIRHVNDNFCKISKYSREELIGQDHHIINSGYHSKEFIQNLWATIGSGKVWKGEIKNKAKDGTLYWVDTTITPFLNSKGKPYQYIAIRNDITFQKKIQEKLAFQNEEIEKRAAELVIANKELIFQNEEKEKRAAELSIANKELLAFTFISSHDMQEPLRQIQTFASIILENESKNLSENGKYNFQRMQLSAARMQLRIEDLLLFSRIATADLKFEKTELSKIVDEVKIGLKDTIKEKHATIEASELCTAKIVPLQFCQLMHNLLGNALKFSQLEIPSHISIKSRIVKGSKSYIEKLSPEKNYCHITVKDNGIGFDSQFSERIFGVFQRLHSKDAYAGTGIGLAIVKKIVENHNGIIIATSELNKGATFDIFIPND